MVGGRWAESRVTFDRNDPFKASAIRVSEMLINFQGSKANESEFIHYGGNNQLILKSITFIRVKRSRKPMVSFSL